MAGSGQTTLDLGPYPGVSDAEFTITGVSGIADASQVEAWIEPATTTAGWGADGAIFNGFGFLTRGANLTGIVNSKLGIVSLWYAPRSPNSRQKLFNSNNSELIVECRGDVLDTRVDVLASGISGFDVNLTALQELSKPSVFRHLIASWDVAANAGSVWVQDVLLDNSISRLADENIVYGSALDWALGVHPSGSGFEFSGAIAEMYFAPGQYLDMTVTANRRKYNQIVGDGTLSPVSLGTDGSTPTGTAPRVYLHLDNGEAAQNFKINRGTGGDFAWNNAANVPSFGVPLIMQPGHSIDEHVVDPPNVRAYSPSAAGSSMKVRLISRDCEFPQSAVNNNLPLISGKWNVGWAWA